MSWMRRSPYNRQTVLFLVSAVLPAVVLIGLALYVISQDSELASRRAADERHRAIDQVHRELTARLNEIVLAEINRRIGAATGNVTIGSAGIVFAARATDLRREIPSPSTAPDAPEGQRLWMMQTAEQLERLADDFSECEGSDRINGRTSSGEAGMAGLWARAMARHDYDTHRADTFIGHRRFFARSCATWDDSCCGHDSDKQLDRGTICQYERRVAPWTLGTSQPKGVSTIRCCGAAPDPGNRGLCRISPASGCESRGSSGGVAHALRRQCFS